MLHQEGPKSQPARPFLFLVFGTLAGVVVGLLAAPRSGRENREVLKRQAATMRDKLQQGRDKAMDAASTAADTAQNALENESDMIGAIAEDANSKSERKH